MKRQDQRTSFGDLYRFYKFYNIQFRLYYNVFRVNVD